MLVTVRVIAQNQLLGRSTESLTDVHVEPTLPVTVAKRGRRRRDGELMGNEVIVGDRIRSQVREISERKRAQRLGVRVVVNLEADVPGVTVTACGSVFLGDTGVR